MTDSILLKADSLVNGDRAKAYGDVHENFQRWCDLLRPLGIVLTPYQLALVMVAGKLARQTHSQKEDNLVDACGYLEIAHRLGQLKPYKLRPHEPWCLYVIHGSGWRCNCGAW